MTVNDAWVLIIRMGNKYLVGLPYTDTLMIRWSSSPYDAYPMHRKRIAKKVAEMVGGEVVCFNPILGEIA